jgi:ABC-type proline/glycine betaine transport system ATPase subunit
VSPTFVSRYSLTERFQDPLSALDAHVGKFVFQRVFMGNQKSQTKILVTHALHFLPQVDYIYTVADGQVKERGTYNELIANDGVFSKFVKEFGSQQEEEEKEDADEIADVVETAIEGKSKMGHKAAAALKEQYEKGKTIMQDEERNTGSVSWKVYKEYILAGNGAIMIPALLLSLLLVQGAQVMSSYWLVFWQDQQFHQPSGFYVRESSSPHSDSS